MDIERPPIEELEPAFAEWLMNLWRRLQDEDIKASDTWDPGNLVADETSGTHYAAKDVTVTGAVMGDYAIASFSNDVVDLQLDAQVTAANTVTCVLINATDAAHDLSSGTIYVRVFRRTI